MSNKYEEILSSEKSSGKMLNVGHGNFLRAKRIVAVLAAGSLPMKRLREKAGELNLLVDATHGRKTKSLIVTDSRHVFLSALSPSTLQERLNEGRQMLSTAQLELEDGEFVS